MAFNYFPMRPARALAATDPLAFGRAVPWADEGGEQPLALSGELRLFATTFAAGFLFVSILIA